MARSTLHRKGQLTIPAAVREALHVSEGDEIEFTIVDGTVVMRGMRSIPTDQLWFWTDEWQAGEHEASEQIRAGKGTYYDSDEDFLDSLSEG